MKVIRNVLAGLVGVLVALSLVVTPSAQADTADARDQAAVAWNAVTGEALAAWECPSGFVCFWTARGGAGSRCAWEGDEDNWAGRKTLSISNRGQSTAFTGVAYFQETDYGTRLGCMQRGKKASVVSMVIMSHRWITTVC